MRELGILFTRDNRESVAKGIKTHTRRIIKEVPLYNHLHWNHGPKKGQPRWIMDWPLSGVYEEDGRFWLDVQIDVDDNTHDEIKPRYQVGDHLYVKNSYFTKKADAEIWLLVTEVKDPHRIQDISEADARAEGATPQNVPHRNPETGEIRDIGLYYPGFMILWNSINAKPKPVKQKNVITHYVSYPWQDIHETRQHRGKPWHVCGNPWVFPYVFVRIEK